MVGGEEEGEWEEEQNCVQKSVAEVRGGWQWRQEDEEEEDKREEGRTDGRDG